MSNEKKFDALSLPVVPGCITASVGQFHAVTIVNVHDNKIGKGEMIFVQLMSKEDVDAIVKQHFECHATSPDPEAHE